MCQTVAIFRSMNGYSDFRIGGTGVRAAAAGARPRSGPGAVRHAERGPERSRRPSCATCTSTAHLRAGRPRAGGPQQARFAESRRPSSRTASPWRTSSASRWICKPLHLLDCCVETDNANRPDRDHGGAGEDLRRKPVGIMGVVGRGRSRAADFHWAHGPINRVAGYHAKDIVFGRGRHQPGGRRRHRLLRRLHLHHHAPARGVRLLQEGRGRPVRLRAASSSSAASGPTHLGWPPLRRLYPRHRRW